MGQTLRVAIVGDPSSYTRALDAATGATHSFGSSLLKLGKYAALGLGAAGVGGAVVALKRGFDEFKESQQVMAQTGAVLKSTGNSAHTSSKQVAALASSLSKLSGADDEAIQSGQNMLLTFTNIRNETGKNNDIFNQATSTLTDFSFAMNKGAAPSAEQLAKNAILLGKALNDPIKGVGALSRVGVTFTEGQKKTIEALIKSGDVMGAQKLILKELNKEFGGSAKAAGETFPGQLNKLKNSFDEISGRIVAKLIPYLQRLIDWINKHMPEIEAGVDAAMKGIGQAIQWLAGQVRTHWGTITSVFQTTGRTIVSIVRNLASFFQTDFGKALAIAGAAAAGFAYYINLATKAIGFLRLAAVAVGGSPQLIAIGLVLTGLTYLAIKLGVIHSPFAKATTDAQKFADALDAAATSSRNVGDTLTDLTQANLNVASARARDVSTLHDLQAAQNNYNGYVKKGTQNTLEGKQAHDQLVAAQIAHKQSALDVASATKEYDAAQVKASQSVRQTVPGMTAFKAGMDNMTHANLLAREAIGPKGVSKVLGELAIKLDTAGAAAVTHAASLAKTNPAAAAAERSFGTLQQAAGRLVIQLGRVPTRKEIIAEAKTIGGPKFTADLTTFVGASQKAGTDIPMWLRKAVEPSKAAVSEVAAGVKSKAPEARAAGTAVGGAIGEGVSKGIYAWIPRVVYAGLQMINQTLAAIRSPKGIESGSPSKKTIEMGKDMTRGLMIGLAALGPSLHQKLVAALSGALDKTKTVASKGLNEVGRLIVAAAKKYGIDARAALAVAMTEGGIQFGGPAGDNGQSFGPFQLATFGELSGKTAAEARKFADSADGVYFALRRMNEEGAKGLTGLAAIKAIVGGPGWGFERPANAAAEVAKAWGYFKTLGPEVDKALVSSGTSIAKTLQGLAALVKEYAPKIGVEHARGIIAGLIGQTGNIVAAAKAQMEKVAAAMAAAAAASTALKDAFKAMAQGALAAFDAVTEGWVPPAQRLLDKMQLEDQINAAVGAVATAQARIDAAIRTRDTLTRGEDESDADFEARKAAADADIKAATEELGAAQRSYDELQLGLRAIAQKKAHDKQRAADRDDLVLDLLQLQTWLAKHPEEYEKVTKKVAALGKKYHLPMLNAGKSLADAFGEGLDSGISTVVAAARKLADALEAIPRALGGGGGGDGTGGGPQKPPDVGGGGGGRGSNMNVTVNLPNYLGDKREAARTIRDEISRLNRDSALA